MCTTRKHVPVHHTAEREINFLSSVCCQPTLLLLFEASLRFGRSMLQQVTESVLYMHISHLSCLFPRHKNHRYSSVRRLGTGGRSGQEGQAKEMPPPWKQVVPVIGLFGLYGAWVLRDRSVCFVCLWEEGGEHGKLA